MEFINKTMKLGSSSLGVIIPHNIAKAMKISAGDHLIIKIVNKVDIPKENKGLKSDKSEDKILTADKPKQKRRIRL